MNMVMKAEIRHTADIDDLLAQLSHKRYSITKDGNETIILYAGAVLEGIDVLEKVLQEGHCHIQITCGY